MFEFCPNLSESCCFWGFRHQAIHQSAALRKGSKSMKAPITHYEHGYGSAVQHLKPKFSHADTLFTTG